jgi:hypothetical protein
VLERRFAGEVLLTAQGRDEVDRLDRSATVVWMLLDEPKTEEKLVDELTEAYGAERAVVLVGVRRLLDDLKKRGYVEFADA